MKYLLSPPLVEGRNRIVDMVSCSHTVASWEIGSRIIPVETKIKSLQKRLHYFYITNIHVPYYKISKILNSEPFREGHYVTRENRIM